MKKLKIVATIVFFLLAINLLPVSAASVIVSIPETCGEPGECVTVPIMLSDVTGLKGAHILLSYDSSVIQVTEISNSSLSFETFKEIDNSEGNARYALIHLDGGLSGDVKFADVTFEAVGSCYDSSSLSLYVFSLDDGGGPDSISRTVDDGTFTITDDGSSTPTPTPTSTPPAAGGGGGGGGKGGGGSSKPGNVPSDDKGNVRRRVMIESKDGVSKITIPEGTIAVDTNGDALGGITIKSLPVGGTIASYDYGPNGASFFPAITITFNFDPKDFKEGSNPVIKTYDGTRWTELKTKIDASKNEASAEVTHFSIYALFEEESVNEKPTSIIMQTEQPPEEIPTSTPIPDPPAQWIMLSGVVFVIMILVGVATTLNSRGGKK